MSPPRISRRTLLGSILAPAFASAAGGEAVLDALEERARRTLAAVRHPASAAEARSRRGELRRRLRASLGYERLPWPPPKPRPAGEVVRDGYRIEKLVFESLPGVEVPAHLYLPATRQERLPAVLFYCGHWWEDSKTRPDFQAFLINMARLGFAAFTFDPFGQGERGVSNRDHRRTELLPVGVSQQGLAEYETQCALHHLLARPEIDPRRIGMTGASGGGYNTWITAALDDRIACAVPVVGTSEFFEQLHVCRPLDWYRANEHCHFVPDLIRYANNHELAAMIAPRPLLIVAAAVDQSFPIAGVRQIHEYARGLYASFNHAERTGLFEDASAGHGYQRAKREAAYGWFRRWLQGEGDGRPWPEPPTETEPWDAPDLRCFPPGENRSAGPGIVAMASHLAARRTPLKSAPDLERILGVRAPSSGPTVTIAGARFEVRQQDGVAIPVSMLRPQGEARGVIIAADDDGKEALAADLLLEEARAAGWAAACADPRGIGELAVKQPGWVFAVSLLLGENFVWRQALDLLAVARQFAGRRLALYGRGQNAALMITYLACWLGRSGELPVDWYVLRDGFVTYRHFIDRPASAPASFTLHTGERFRTAAYDREIPHHYFVFDVLRHFDLPDLLAAIAAPGLLVNPIDGDWKRLREVEARAILGSARLQLACDAAGEDVSMRFRKLLSAAG
jgi:dienelactone hydrolase